MDYGFAPGVTPWEIVRRQMLERRRDTRWVDGSTHLRIGPRKQVGRGEGSSGLRFDTIE